jgi:protein-disulfide isomerase
MNYRWDLLINKILVLAVLGLAVSSGFAQTKPASSSSTATAGSATALPSEAVVEGFLKQMFGWNQELTWKVVEIKAAEAPGFAEVTAVFNTPQGQQVFRLFVTPDQKFAVTGDIVPFGADPFAAARADLKGVNGPVEGAADAAVTIVEFGDLECPACKAAQPNITKLLGEEPKVKLVFQNFPLESIHKWSFLGAKYVECVAQAKNETVWKFISTVYEHQGDVTAENADAMLKGYAKEAGADPAAVAACVAKPETEKLVRESLALGTKLNVTSTPTFFINGRKVVGFGSNTPYDVVKSMVDYMVNTPAK